MYTQPYGQTPPMHDPAAPSTFPPQSGPQHPYQTQSLWRNGSFVLVFILVLAAFGVGGYTMIIASHPGSATQVRSLARQVGTLKGQVAALQGQHARDAGTISSLSAKVGTLSGQVSGMTATVNYMGQFKGSCIVTSQGQSGPFNAPVPCKPGG